MSGECDKCGEHRLECKCYERCKCDKHPATHADEFNMVISEFGMLDIILEQEIDAICKICGDKFYFKQKFCNATVQYRYKSLMVLPIYPPGYEFWNQYE